MTPKIKQALTSMLILAVICTSVLMFTPLEEADAWPLHICKFQISNNNGEWELITKFFIHDHWLSCGFVCPGNP